VTHDPIRIARIITRLNVGGPAIQAVTLTARLESLGYHTLLVHGRVGAGEGDMSYLIPREGAFEVAHLPALRREIAPAADGTALAQLVGRVRQFRPHVVHSHMAKAGSLGRLAALAYNATQPRTARARIVHTYHGHVLEGYFQSPVARAFSSAERLLARRSDALIAVSPAVKRDLVETHRIGSAARFRVVPLGFDLDPFAAVGAEARKAARATFGLDPAAHVVSLVGRLTAIKQPDRFLAAAARVAADDPRTVFLIAGGGELEPALRSQTATLGLDRRVSFLGWQRDVSPVYAASDVVALTSRNEGTPVALIESMATAVPCVAFDVGGVRDVITNPDIGVLVPEGDVHALAAAVTAFLRDDSKRIAMGARARADVLARYGVDRLVRDMDAVYRSLL